MFRQDSAEDKVFRAAVRTWFAENLPDRLCHKIRLPSADDMRMWQGKLYEGGWAGLSWPTEFGGRGASLSEQIIFAEEQVRVGAPRVTAGGDFLAPALMRFGTDAQRKEHLTKMLTGEAIWAQGSSEPGAGSDLASLVTRAEPRDGGFVVNGQKIWNTGAHTADWMYALVRTDQDATPKHAGISILMFDLKTAGITRRGITNLLSDDEFATVFFDDVFVPDTALLGPLNGGWKVMSYVMSTERLSFGNPAPCTIALDLVEQVARETGADRNPDFCDRLADIDMQILSLSALFNHAVGLTTNGIDIGAEASIMKLVGTEMIQTIGDLLAEASGGFGATLAAIETGDTESEVGQTFLHCRRMTMGGGTSEIHRNVIAKRVINLP